MKYRYVVVEGPIGSGKTTLARRLADRYDADLIMEELGANPFLPLFYRDMKRHALATQMFFLFQLYNHLRPQAPTPDLVIYLQTSVEHLMARIQRRGRPMEKGISEDYMMRLCESYTRHFYEYSESPLLIVNSDRFDFADNREHFEMLVTRIESLRGMREYFNAA